MDTPADTVAYFHNKIDTSEQSRLDLEESRAILFSKYQDNGEQEDIQLLNEIIKIDLRLLKLSFLSEANYTAKCNELSSDFMARYWLTKRSADLARAVYFIRLIVAINIPSPGFWLSLEISPETALFVKASIIIAKAAQERGSKNHFEEAVQLARLATTLTAPDVPIQEFFLENLAYVLDKRFNLLGNPTDLKETIHIFEEVAKTAQETSPSNLDEKLFQLGKAIFKSWELYRDPRDLKKAIQVFDDILQCPNATKVVFRQRLLQYTTWLFFVYQYSPEVQYLDKSDALLVDASKLPAKMVNSELRLLIAQGTSYGMRAERLHDVNSARCSITVFEEGLNFAPVDYEVRIVLLNNLINSSIRFCILNNSVKDEVKEYLDKIEARLAKESYLRDFGILINSARLQHLWYQHANDEAALKEAVRRVQIALQINDTDFLRMVPSAIPVLKDYWSLTRLSEDFDLAYSIMTKVWNSPSESPHVKIQVARDAAEMLYKAGRIQEGWQILKQAVEIIVLACPRNLPREDQRFIISRLSGLSNDACAVGIAAGVEMTEVLQTLESGRGLAVSLAHGANEDFRYLNQELRNLLANFEDSRSRVYFSNVSSDFPRFDENYQNPRKAEDLRTSIQDEFQELSKKVQGHPELKALLEPPRASLFQSLAADGPIIVVNSSTFRNDVILITTSKISTFRLEDDSPELLARFHGRRILLKDLAQHILKLISRGDQGQWRGIWFRNQTLQGVLIWLWDFVVKRVCQELQLLEMHSFVNLTRVWWLPTGYFTQLPFHAAGDVKECSPEKLMINRAMSSYISSFRMLKWARSRALNISNVKLDGLIVTMAAPNPKRPRDGSIFVRTATAEADAMEQLAGSIPWLRRDKPSAADVMAELPRKSFMHFCCHGESDPEEPSQSHLKLFKKTVENDDDPRNVDTLTAGSISTAVTNQSVLAVLSACYTAEIRELTHLDEGLQIGNAFQIAGFPHVIGSLWAASDVTCPKWSRIFYSTLNYLMSLAPLSNSHIAIAYHVAMVEILNEDPDWAILWAPFVHIGA